ncbi:MAG: GNAT family N-acetyltransferase [Candidatus Melainabacteria bacterium]|nr:GNAT family N-acetyltransferase [Candidatus Melainabacteria bacterium]
MIELRTRQLNALEPASLTESFHKFPPEDFTSIEIGYDDTKLSAFFARFNLLTTLDDDQMWIANRLNKFGLSQITCLNTLFSGTTVTEYSVLPRSKNIKGMIDAYVDEAIKQKAQLLIVKDLPLDSPLLSDEENQSSKFILDICSSDKRFLVLDGQALAYVPINFDTIDNYLAKQSKLRRKDLRKKLKKRNELEVKEEKTGSYFENPHLLEQMYALYLNVFEQSKYHFDKLSFGFFKEILTSNNGGIVFLYYHDTRLIGYNICFVHNNNLIDKYVGFSYPEARDFNLYFISWFVNLEYAIKHNLKNYVAGWTDPEVKAYLGASFTFTKHAVFIRNSILRKILTPFKIYFENDSNWQKQRS